MKPEDYLEFEKFETKHGVAERIRIKGHRIAIEHVIEAFNQGMTPEDVVQKWYPSLTLEEVSAVLTYYQQNKEAVDDYLRRGEAIADAYYQEYLQQEPSPVLKKLRALKAERQAGETPP